MSTTDIPSGTIQIQPLTTVPFVIDGTLIDDPVALVDDPTALSGGQITLVQDTHLAVDAPRVDGKIKLSR